ncbi:hypothetical protein [Salarchaeum japonicum]|uniref:Lipoprotein n=1 Tax=Salarchaeum japonicum TaxID=555573 RepID=A0AAV3T5G6_9EURY|nr:hypothetical protein [Salarchaeum japonicum]
MRRREFLAGGTALLALPAAGCIHPPVVLDMSEATLTDIADERSDRLAPDSEEHDIVTAARNNSSVTRTRPGKLFDDANAVRVGRTFYEVTETAIDTVEVTTYELHIDFNPGDATPSRGEIEYAELPPADAERLDDAVTLGSRRTAEGDDISVRYGRAAEVGESVFVPDPEYDILVHDGDRYRVTVTSERDTWETYRYAVTEVAAGLSEFVEPIRERYRFTLSGLSEAEREVVETAIDEGYFEESDAFQSLVERFHAHEKLSGDDAYGTWLVRYEGTEYLAYSEWE